MRVNTYACAYIDVSLVNLVDEHVRDASKAVLHATQQSAHRTIQDRPEWPIET